MKFALITPPQGFQVEIDLRLGYHFALAQYCGDPEYANHYHALGLAGHFTMLDNGAAEIGSAIALQRLMEAADLINPDEIILPDVLDDADKTLVHTARALDRIAPHARAMCPQGKTWEEWTFCADQMIQMGCATLCIAKRYEKLPGGRVHALEIARDRGWDRDHNIHLLGCCYDPLKEVERAQMFMPHIRGVDTAAPVAYAQHAQILGTIPHQSLEWDEPFDNDTLWVNTVQMLSACGGNHAHSTKG